MVQKCNRIIRGFEESVACEMFVLRFGEGNHGETADADERRVGEELVGFDLGERDWFGDGLACFDLDGGILGIGSIDGNDGGGAYGGLVVAGFVDDEFVAGLHRAKVAEGDGIVDAIPDGGFVALQVGERICGGFGFQEIRRHVVPLLASDGPILHGERKQPRLLFLCGSVARDGLTALRMGDEFGKTLVLCLFPFCADDPISGDALVPRGLRTEEFPSGFVGAKLFLLLASKARGFTLLIGVDGGFFFAARGESSEAGGMHQTLLGEVVSEFDIDSTPVAGGLTRSETNGVAGFVEPLADTVNPAEAEGDRHGFWPCDAGLAGILLVETDEKFTELVVMDFEPGPEIGWRGEELWIRRHGVD